MPTTEHTINDALAALLRETRHAWRDPHVVSSENTGMLSGSAGQPDLLVMEPTVFPVAVETEVLPAATVEADATARLGKEMRGGGRALFSSVAVRLPPRLREEQDASLRTALLAATDLDLVLFTGRTPAAPTRWPRSGWMVGGVAELSFLVQSAAVPPDVIAEAVEQLTTGVSQMAVLLDEMATRHPACLHWISEYLCQEDGHQTRCMAATILVNALVFQETLAGGPGGLADVKPLNQVRRVGGVLFQPEVLAGWRRILEVNYWPIFDIARRIIEAIPLDHAAFVMERLEATALALIHERLMSSHDLTGAVFQRLIADRKLLAAFYTTPPAAALLAGLALPADRTPTGGTWASADDVKALRIADFACGTGTLLSTAYRRLSQLHELAGGDAAALHPQMMASGLTGCDVLPAATHLTASMLAGAHPMVKYAQSSILTVAYGKQPDGQIALGSLDLLDPQGKFEVLAITAKAVESMGQSERATWRALPHASFDVVIMNPPFTRPTGEGRTSDTPNPMFAAFGSSTEEQRLMGDAIRRLTAGTSAHGNAGEASIFLVLADRKLKPGGALALVMPLSLLSGEAWEDSRRLLAQQYGDLVLISIAAATDAAMSFSADTGMGECLVVGRKTGRGSKRATFVILRERPALPMLGARIAEQLQQLMAAEGLRRLEEGPVGGTPLYVGNDLLGQALDAPLPAAGGWKLARIADLSLAQAAYQLATRKRVWLPTMNKSAAVGVPITTAAALGEIGPCDRDINGDTAAGGIRGPFDVSPVVPGGVPTYPVLWAHEANRERTLAFDADCEGQPRRAPKRADQKAIDAKVARVWATASHCHLNSDFRFNSQSTAMQFTPRASVGGRAWVSLRLASVEQEKALVLWANTSFGLLLYWWHANKPQSGRGSVRRVALRALPVLDVRALCPVQLAKAASLFDALCGKPLLPLHELSTDRHRRELDERFAHEVLGLPESLLTADGPLAVLRAKLAQEPSIRGGK